MATHGNARAGNDMFEKATSPNSDNFSMRSLDSVYIVFVTGSFDPIKYIKYFAYELSQIHP